MKRLSFLVDFFKKIFLRQQDNIDLFAYKGFQGLNLDLCEFHLTEKISKFWLKNLVERVSDKISVYRIFDRDSKVDFLFDKNFHFWKIKIDFSLKNSQINLKGKESIMWKLKAENALSKEVLFNELKNLRDGS